MGKKGIIWGLVFLVILVGAWFIWGNDKETLDDNNESEIINIQATSSAPAINEITSTQGEAQTINNLDENKQTMNATLHTNKGDIKIEFFDTITPNTVANFTKLAKEGFYNGVKFHRVIKGFMVQGGDPLTKDDSKMSLWGTGGPGYAFADEIDDQNKNNIGTISMANAGPNTNGSQFFINTADNNFLDTKHTVFGKVVAGMDVVTAIENTSTGSQDRPIEPIIIESISLE